MGINRKLRPLLASSLLAALTLIVASKMPQPSAAELQALAAMNSVPVEKRGDCRGFLRYWLFGTATPSVDVWAGAAPAQPQR